MWKVGTEAKRYILDEEYNWIADCKNEKIAEQIVEEHNKLEYMREQFPKSMMDFEGCYKHQIKPKIISEQERLEMVHKHSE